MFIYNNSSSHIHIEMAKAIGFLVLLLVSPAAYAVTYNVGNSSGWTTGVNYTNWARGLTFTTGDTLVFTFGPAHAVDVVSVGDYGACNNGNPTNTYTSSPATVTLNATGALYFICPRGTHCSQGQRLAINVTEGTTSPPGGSPPSVPSTPGTPPSTATPPPPSAAAALGGGDGLVVGLMMSLVLAAVMGVMG